MIDKYNIWMIPENDDEWNKAQKIFNGCDMDSDFNSVEIKYSEIKTMCIKYDRILLGFLDNYPDISVQSFIRSYRPILDSDFKPKVIIDSKYLKDLITFLYKDNLSYKKIIKFYFHKEKSLPVIVKCGSRIGIIAYIVE
jgi:hypothetical protein